MFMFQNVPRAPQKNVRKRIHAKYLLNLNPKGTLFQIHVDSTSILGRYVEQQISTNILVISTYFLDVISLIEKSTSFPRTFFDLIFADPKILVVSTYFFWCNFDDQKINVVSTSFYWCNFAGRKTQFSAIDVISMAEKSTLFPRTFFDVFFFVKISTFFPPWSASPWLILFHVFVS